MRGSMPCRADVMLLLAQPRPKEDLLNLNFLLLSRAAVSCCCVLLLLLLSLQSRPEALSFWSATLLLNFLPELDASHRMAMLRMRSTTERLNLLKVRTL